MPPGRTRKAERSRPTPKPASRKTPALPHPDAPFAPVRKAVFPAAGLGTRFLPATKAMPKEMLPLVDRPVIQYAVEEAVASGIESITFVTGRGKNAIEDHFDVSPGLERFLEDRGQHGLLKVVREIANLVQVSYVRQKAPLGLGHAVLTAADMVGPEPFAVLLGDDVCHAEVPVLRQLLDVHARFGDSVIAVERISPEDTASYGIVDAEEIEPGLFRIRDMVEKPLPEDAPSNLAVIGRYILTPEIFEELRETPPDAKGEIQLTNGLRRLLGRQPIYAYAFAGKRYDTGNKLGFAIAMVEWTLRHPELGKAFRRYLRDLDV